MLAPSQCRISDIARTGRNGISIGCQSGQIVKRALRRSTVIFRCARVLFAAFGDTRRKIPSKRYWRGKKGQFTLTCRYERTCMELQNNAVISNSTARTTRPKQTFPNILLESLFELPFIAAQLECKQLGDTRCGRENVAIYLSYIRERSPVGKVR